MQRFSEYLEYYTGNDNILEMLSYLHKKYKLEYLHKSKNGWYSLNYFTKFMKDINTLPTEFILSRYIDTLHILRGRPRYIYISCILRDGCDIWSYSMAHNLISMVHSKKQLDFFINYQKNRYRNECDFYNNCRIVIKNNIRFTKIIDPLLWINNMKQWSLIKYFKLIDDITNLIENKLINVLKSDFDNICYNYTEDFKTYDIFYLNY
jgi:hypothetical protein